MSQRVTPGPHGDETGPENPPPSEGYEPPEIEDLLSPNGPSVTAAGIHTTTIAAPRQL